MLWQNIISGSLQTDINRYYTVEHHQRLPLWKPLFRNGQTTADIPRWLGSCCSAQRCPCLWRSSPAGSRHSLLQGTLRLSPDPADPGTHKARSSLGCGAWSWDKPPGPCPESVKRCWRPASLPQTGPWRCLSHLPAPGWGFGKLWRSWSCRPGSHQNCNLKDYVFFMNRI